MDGNRIYITESKSYLLHNDFFRLLDDLVNPDLNLLLLGITMVGLLLASILEHSKSYGGSPGIPFVDKTLPSGDDFRTRLVLIGGVFLLECAAELLEVAPDFLLLILGQQTSWPRAPEELLESIQNMFLQLLSSEVPDSVPVLKLHQKKWSIPVVKKSGEERGHPTYRVSPGTRTGGKVTTAGVPFHVSDTVVVGSP